MTERNGETAHKNVRRHYRKYKKKLRKKIATLLIKKENVKNSIHTEDSGKILKSKNKKVKPKLKKTEINKHISNKSNYTSHQSKELSNKKTTSCSQWPTQPSAGKSHCPGRKSKKKWRPSFPHPPGKHNRSSDAAHRPPDTRCESQGPPSGAQAASAPAEAPGPPGSYSACTTCNK
jgi:hypothetical protein